MQGSKGAKIVFIVIPTIYIILNSIIVFSGFNKILFEYVHDILYGQQIPIISILIFISFIAFVSLYPWGKKWEFFIENGIENIIEEYNFLLQFCKYAVPLLVILILIYFLSGGKLIDKFYSLVYFDYHGLSQFQNIIRILIIPLYIITYAAILKTISFNQNRFFLAKGCAILFLEKRDTIDKMAYLIMCLRFYDKYLQNKINLHIRNIEKMSTMMAASIPPQKNIINNEDNDNQYDMNNRSLKFISLNLVNEFNKENDQLAPLRFLTNFLEKEEKIEDLLIKERLFQKVQESPILIPAIPATVTILVAIINVVK